MSIKLSGDIVPRKARRCARWPADCARCKICLSRGLRGPVTGLLFDMGDVLYDATLWRRWLLQLLGRLGLRTDYRTFYRTWDREYLKQVHRGRSSFCAAFRQFLTSVGLSPAQIDEVELACRAQRRLAEAGTRPLPGVKATLARLHAAGLTLGVLSDSELPAAALWQHLERFGLADNLSTVVSSVDLGQTKPDPMCYLKALRAMDMPVQSVAFVGHDAEELAGAAAVGMQTIAFNFDSDAEADVYIARFEELLDLVGARSPLAAAG